MSYTHELMSKHYDQALELRRQGFTYRAIAKKIGVSKTQIHRWLSNFVQDYKSSAMHPSTMKAKRITSTVAPRSVAGAAPDVAETDAQKIARLERMLKEESLRADFYEEMINVAEAQFKISIRKKAGAGR